MQSDIVTTYIGLRKKLVKERAELESRLQQVSQALDQTAALTAGVGRRRKAGRPKTAAPAGKRKRRLSAEGRRRIIEATKARWAKLRARKAGKAAKPAKRRFSAAARAKMAAATKARWEAARAAGKTRL
ncbi:MAG: hypothetical protein JXQ71_17480 [Verrucomicrobia bacterium]|nr:hypothetical protein [Verrucomicrobiota bacterium]